MYAAGWTALLGCIATACCSSITSSLDPCTSYSELPRAEYRGGQCPFVSNKAVCDRTLTSGWYRAVGRNGDLQMQETNAAFGTCGTKFPFWMNGTHPSIADGEVLREVCMTSVRSYCDDTQTISVKNCGAFYVYKLDAVPSCPTGYCFGETEACPPFDPCDVYENVRIKYDAGRSSVCNKHGDASCDTFDPNTWYSFRNPLFGYLNVTTQCPPDRHACGTQHALYLDRTSTYPGTVDEDGSLETEVCEQDYPTCCSRRFNIRIKECKGFMVYKFPSSQAQICHRYCLDDSTATCPTTTTTTTTATTTATSTTTVSPQSTSQITPGQTTLTDDKDKHGSDNPAKYKSVAEYIWIIAGVAVVAVITIITAAVLIVKIMSKNRTKVIGSPVVSYSQSPPPYSKQ